MVDNMAALNTMAMLDLLCMPAPHSPNKHVPPAEQLVAELFRSINWSVKTPDAGADLVIERGAERFIIEVKTVSESRPDRVIPMLSQAILQSKAAAEQDGNARPLAIIYVPDVSSSLARHVDSFAKKFANDVPVGIVSRNGSQYFTGAAFQHLNRLPEELNRSAAPSAPQTINLFSDLNQWMLKLLLAWELPEDLLNAPRKKFRNGSDLADAAQVSAMSASRFLHQLRSDGHLSESSSHLQLVRRDALFRRWSAATMRSGPDLPCRFLLRASAPKQIRDLMSTHLEDACLGLFAAADELGMGHVSGVPPYVYVRKLPQVGTQDWSVLMANPNERPDLILRQAPYLQSTFRGAVSRNGIMVTDIIQTWLDVMHHPSRGAEQANVIHQRFLLPLGVSSI